MEDSPWKPCTERGLTCDGVWHRGWDGHDPYCERCPRPKPPDEIFAHLLLGTFCACYGEAWPADTCAIEAKKLATWLRFNRFIPTEDQREAMAMIISPNAFALRQRRNHPRQDRAYNRARALGKVDAILIYLKSQGLV